MMIKRKYPLYIIAGFLLLMAWEMICKPSFDTGFYINQTESEPIGIYKRVPLTDLKSGDFVIIDVPESARPYIYGRHWAEPGTPILKEVGALEGVRCIVRKQSFYINDQYIGMISSQDLDGLPLPELKPGQYTVSKDHFMAVSTYNNNSFDSRYIGEIPITSIRAKVVPWLIFDAERNSGELFLLKLLYL